MSIGKRCDTPLHRQHKWANKVLPYDGGDVVRVEVHADETILINWNPADSPEGFKPMDPEE